MKLISVSACKATIIDGRMYMIYGCYTVPF